MYWQWGETGVRDRRRAAALRRFVSETGMRVTAGVLTAFTAFSAFRVFTAFLIAIQSPVVIQRRSNPRLDRVAERHSVFAWPVVPVARYSRAIDRVAWRASVAPALHEYRGADVIRRGRRLSWDAPR